MNKRVQEILTDFGAVRWITPGSSAYIADIGRPGLRKLFGGAISLCRYFAASIHGYRRHIAYLSPATTGGAAYRDRLVWVIAVLTANSVIVHLHSGDLSQLGCTGRLPSLNAWLQRHSELWVVGEVFRRALPMAPAVRVVANGVSCHAARHSANLARDGGTLGVVFLGNHFMVKGVDTAAELASRMIDAPVKWTFAGSPVDAAAEALLNSLATGVELDRVKHVDAEVRCRLLSSASCLLMPSRYEHEAAPLVVLEALNHGVVPIVSDRGALSEMVGSAGYVCRDLEDYESALRELLGDPARLYELSQRALTRWAAHYTDDVFADRVRHLLRDAIRRSPYSRGRSL